MTDPANPGAVPEQALIEALAWYVELGADEAIADAPIDRTEAPPPPKVVPLRKRQPTAPAPQPARRDVVSEARALAEAAQTLADLKAALSQFDGSPLREMATQAVFEDGHPAADLMIVGEAPGREEDRVGKPFVGKSGKLLDRMLAAIGRDRQSEEPATGAYIANVIPYRPLQNRTPDDAEVACFLPFIERQIALARPKAILCLGNVPAKHLMSAQSGITRFRGTWIDYSRAGLQAPALASFHPAYLLRSPDKKREAWRDLLSLQERLEALP